MAAFLVVEAAAFLIAGNRDQPQLGFWSIGFAVLAGLGLRFTAEIVAGIRSNILSFALLPIAGAAMGIAYAALVAVYLGPLAGAFSVPLLPVFTTAGATAALVAACVLKFTSRVNRAVAGSFLTATGVAVSVVLANATGPEEISIVSYRLREEPGKVRVGHGFSLGLEASELAWLESCGLRGQLEPAITSVFGSDGTSPVAVVFVMTRPIKGAVEFPIPASGRVVYAQTPDGRWCSLPKLDHGTRVVVLRPSDDGPSGSRYTHIVIPSANGTAIESVLVGPWTDDVAK